MKGLIFTEFLEMVEKEFGYTITDEIITRAAVPNNGAYTSVGTYSHHELVSMVVALHEVSGISISDLLKTYGRYLFGRLAAQYPTLVSSVKDPFDMLKNLEEVIHVEVKKIYPDAKPPMFETLEASDKHLLLRYKSSRKMADVAEGLIHGCADYFGEVYEVKQQLEIDDGSSVLFNITR